MTTTRERPRPLELANRLLERSLRNGGAVCLTVRGACMHPLLRTGDEARVEATSRPRAGDIVLARNAGGELVCHRLLKQTRQGALVAGDRSLSPELQPAATLLGRVREVHRGDRTHRLDRRRHRWLNRLAAGLHLLSWRMRRQPGGRWLEAGRHRFLNLSAWITQA